MMGLPKPPRGAGVEEAIGVTDCVTAISDSEVNSWVEPECVDRQAETTQKMETVMENLISFLWNNDTLQSYEESDGNDYNIFMRRAKWTEN